MSLGIDVSDKHIDFDGTKYLNLPLVNDRTSIFKDSFIDFSNLNTIVLEKQSIIKNIPSEPIIRFHAFTDDINAIRSNSSKFKLYILVNGFIVDITDSIIKQEANDFIISVQIPQSKLDVGLNEFQLSADKMQTFKGKLGIITQDIYVVGSSFKSSDNGLNWQKESREYLFYLLQEHSFFEKFLFKLSFIFRFMGIICLFIALHGLGFVKKLLTKHYLALIFSTVIAYLTYWFSEFVKGYWYFFSSISGLLVNFLFKITFFKPTFIPSQVPVVGIEGFIVRIYDICSGVDGLGFFTLAYFVLIVVSWSKIKWWKAIIGYFVGLLGAFLLNILRIYFIILVGAFISRDFAMNAFHTNIGMVLIIIYFLIFLSIALKYIEKKPDEPKKPKIRAKSRK